MSKDKKSKVSQKYLRGLLKLQEGKCAITGKKLKPEDISADHIIPLSRKELDPSMGKKNVWLVDKKVNQFKRTMTYDELIDTCKSILDNEDETRKIQKKINNESIGEMELNDFLDWIENHTDDDGNIKI